MSGLGSAKVWVAAVGAVALLGAGAWGLWGRGGEGPDAVGLPKELTFEGLKAQSDEPDRMMDTVRGAMRREDLSDEQRQALRDNMRRVWEERIQAHVEEYYAAAEEDKEAVLDRHIDQFQAQMEEWERRRKEREAERKKNGEPEDADREGPRGFFGQRSQQERKAQSESRNPDQMARAMAYFSAMRARAEARGIRMPWGPGRGGPGRGGGPGARPGGRSGGSGPRRGP